MFRFFRMKLPERRTILDEAMTLLARAEADRSIQVHGGSMSPTLASGSVIRVDFRQRSPRFGDLLVFRQADYLAVHRYLGTARLADGAICLRTRGDGILALDPPVEPSRVAGRVVALERNGVWRSLLPRRARVYAWLVAFHDLAFAAIGVLSGRADRRLGRAVLHPRVEWLDRGLLRLAHAALFVLLHPRVPVADAVPREGRGPEPGAGQPG